MRQARVSLIQDEIGASPRPLESCAVDQLGEKLHRRHGGLFTIPKILLVPALVVRLTLTLTNFLAHLSSCRRAPPGCATTRAGTLDARIYDDAHAQALQQAQALICGRLRQADVQWPPVQGLDKRPDEGMELTSAFGHAISFNIGSLSPRAVLWGPTLGIHSHDG